MFGKDRSTAQEVRKGKCQIDGRVSRQGLPNWEKASERAVGWFAPLCLPASTNLFDPPLAHHRRMRSAVGEAPKAVLLRFRSSSGGYSNGDGIGRFSGDLEGVPFIVEPNVA